MPIVDFPPLHCDLAGSCSGCAWIGKPYDRQIEDKLARLAAEWARAGVAQAMPDVAVRSISPGGLRDRADLMIDARSGERRIGLFATAARDIVDMAACPQFSPGLNGLLAGFRAVRLPIERGSARLRVSPTGEFGVWLDLANLDVKALLDERESLERLKALAFVEIGQKRKALVEREGALKLGDPDLRPWFETYLNGETGGGSGARAAAIYTTVGGFTQPGFAANKILVAEARAAWRGAERGRAAEFGPGSGNFTLPLAADGFEVDAYEVDPLAGEGLKKGVAAAGLAANVRVRIGDFQRSPRQVELEGLPLLFVDPPRSGLLSFLDPLARLASERRPRRVVYVSCFAESFCADARRLAELGYAATTLTLVDQFPQSPHFETVARFDLR